MRFRIIFFTAILISSKFSFAGFPAGTVVKTTSTLINIESLKVGDFFVSPNGILVHNIAPVAIGLSLLFGAGAFEFLSASFSLAALGTILGFKLHKNKKIESQIAFFNSPCGGSPGPEDPDDNWKRKKSNKWHTRKKNLITKKDFFESVGNDYQHWRDGIYKRRKQAQGLAGAEYLQWDNLHCDVEAYDARGRHVGSIEPSTKQIYKNAVFGRKIIL